MFNFRILALGISFAFGCGSLTADEPMSSERLQTLVEQLSSDQYGQREIASLTLADAGIEAVPVLVKAAQRGDLELTERTMQLLQRLAMKETPDDEPVGWDAITGLARNASGTAASRARSALQTIAKAREETARDQLQAAGVRVGLSEVVLEANQISEEVAHLPATWEGEPSSLSWFEWLYGIHYAAVEGPAIDGEVIAQIVKIPDLQNVVIANAKLTAADLEPLLQLTRIDQLEIRYTPIDDAAIDLLGRLALRQKLVLNATDISPEGVAKLRGVLSGLQIIYKRGGFLGVNCDPWAAQCEISRVVAGGAAERAGLRAGDIITAIGDAPVGRFADLQEAIYGYAAGEAVTVTIERFGVTEKVAVTLGSLQSEAN